MVAVHIQKSYYFLLRTSLFNYHTDANRFSVNSPGAQVYNPSSPNDFAPLSSFSPSFLSLI